MRLTKKTVQQKDNKPAPVDKQLFETDWDSEILHGKWIGSTLKEVKQKDGFYYSWMLKEGLIEKWGLIKLKGSAMKVKKAKPQWQHIVWHDGSEVVGLRECPGTGRPYEE